MNEKPSANLAELANWLRCFHTTLETTVEQYDPKHLKELARENAYAFQEETGLSVETFARAEVESTATEIANIASIQEDLLLLGQVGVKAAKLLEYARMTFEDAHRPAARWLTNGKHATAIFCVLRASEEVYRQIGRQLLDIVVELRLLARTEKPLEAGVQEIPIGRGSKWTELYQLYNSNKQKDPAASEDQIRARAVDGYLTKHKKCSREDAQCQLRRRLSSLNKSSPEN